MNYKAYQDCKFDKAYAMAKTRMDVADNKLRAGNQDTCSVGCMFENYEHELSEAYYNIYPQCTYTLDAIYEGLPTKAESDQFHIDYYDAIPIGGDTKQAWHNFMSQLMLDTVNGMIVSDKTDSSEKVGLLHLRAARGDMPSYFDWKKIASSERAEWAAWKESVPKWAAKAAKAAKWAAGAARAAAMIREWPEARDKHYQWQRDTLLQCLRDC